MVNQLKSFADDFASLLSTILAHPLVSGATVLIMSLGNPDGGGDPIAPSAVALGVLFISVFPVTAVVYHAWRGNVDLNVSSREKRPLFFVPALLSYVAASVLFWFFSLRPLYIVSVCYVAVTSATFAFTLRWKISIHTAAVAGPITLLAFSFGPVMLPLYLLVAALFWARVHLGAHSATQAAMGVLVSTAVTSLVCLLLR